MTRFTQLNIFTEPEFISSDIAMHTAKKIRNRILTLELRNYLKTMKMTLGLRKCGTIEVKKYNTTATVLSAFFTNNGPAKGSSH